MVIVSTLLRIRFSGGRPARVADCAMAADIHDPQEAEDDRMIAVRMMMQAFACCTILLIDFVMTIRSRVIPICR
ncbi:MAG: hypothetical protein RBR01_07355 [Desulfobacterales bacterium]|jgi:hypothetical protein|nr:hypothetical protein [Desulfobacterales bacterium]MDD3080857.1 hypothetical protein [Desulfobacterales bacterium]MDD3949850.1 hypothetical protein [Desulfobacterales bacterium]MDY0378240.1 hypothetical protein [Desulfobacterales bacterium]